MMDEPCYSSIGYQPQQLLKVCINQTCTHCQHLLAGRAQYLNVHLQPNKGNAASRRTYAWETLYVLLLHIVIIISRTFVKILEYSLEKKQSNLYVHSLSETCNCPCNSCSYGHFFYHLYKMHSNIEVYTSGWNWLPENISTAYQLHPLTSVNN